MKGPNVVPGMYPSDSQDIRDLSTDTIKNDWFGPAVPLLVILILIFDIVTPLGFSVWLLYFIPLFLCFRSDREYAVPALCAATLLFLSTGYLLSPPGMHTSFAIVNRILFAGIFICASVALWKFQRHAARLEREIRSEVTRPPRSHPSEDRTSRFSGNLNTRLIPALRSVRESLKVLRTGKAPVNTGELAQSEETIAHAEQEILFTEKLDMVGKTPPQWQNLSEIIRQRIPGTRKHGIDIDIAKGSLWLYADPLLPDVLDELIDNTMKHGMVSKMVRIGWSQDNKDLVITYEDDGIGIPFSQKERIFHNTIGRGLVLAREILGVTGISISETGTPEQGARFAFHVPEGKYRLS